MMTPSKKVELYSERLKKLDEQMSAKTFPEELMEAARDKQVRAASKSAYAYQDDNVSLLIRRPDGGRIVLRRYRGEVIPR